MSKLNSKRNKTFKFRTEKGRQELTDFLNSSECATENISPLSSQWSTQTQSQFGPSQEMNSETAGKSTAILPSPLKDLSDNADSR